MIVALFLLQFCIGRSSATNASTDVVLSAAGGCDQPVLHSWLEMCTSMDYHDGTLYFTPPPPVTYRSPQLSVTDYQIQLQSLAKGQCIVTQTFPAVNTGTQKFHLPNIPNGYYNLELKANAVVNNMEIGFPVVKKINVTDRCPVQETQWSPNIVLLLDPLRMTAQVEVNLQSQALSCVDRYQVSLMQANKKRDCNEGLRSDWKKFQKTIDRTVTSVMFLELDAGFYCAQIRPVYPAGACDWCNAKVYKGPCHSFSTSTQELSGKNAATVPATEDFHTVQSRVTSGPRVKVVFLYQHCTPQFRSAVDAFRTLLQDLLHCTVYDYGDMTRYEHYDSIQEDPLEWMKSRLLNKDYRVVLLGGDSAKDKSPPDSYITAMFNYGSRILDESLLTNASATVYFPKFSNSSTSFQTRISPSHLLHYELPKTLAKLYLDLHRIELENPDDEIPFDEIWSAEESFSKFKEAIDNYKRATNGTSN